MLVYVRPSNEALLRARVPGAQDQRGCPSLPFDRARSATRRPVCLLPAVRPRVARAPGVANGPVDSLSAALLDS